MIVCYESDVLFVAGLSIGLWVASVVGMGCAMFSMKKKSYSDQIEELMFEHIVKQLHEINIAEAFEQEEEEQEQEQDQEQEQESDAESEEQEEQEESEESNDADNEQEEEQEQDIEYVEETQTDYDDLPDLVEEPPAPVESPSESSDDMAPPSKRARRGRGRGRGRSHT